MRADYLGAFLGPTVAAGGLLKAASRKPKKKWADWISAVTDQEIFWDGGTIDWDATPAPRPRGSTNYSAATQHHLGLSGSAVNRAPLWTATDALAADVTHVFVPVPERSPAGLILTREAYTARGFTAGAVPIVDSGGWVQTLINRFRHTGAGAPFADLGIGQ